MDELERLATVPAARDRVTDVFKQLGIWVGIDFKAARWGKRSVRKVSSGIISIGPYKLPVPIHGRDNCDPPNPEGDCGCSAGPTVATAHCTEMPDDGDAESADLMAKVSKEGDSLTMDSRGDRIRTCDLLVPNQSRYQPAPRPEFNAFGQDRLCVPDVFTDGI